MFSMKARKAVVNRIMIQVRVSVTRMSTSAMGLTYISSMKYTTLALFTTPLWSYDNFDLVM